MEVAEEGALDAGLVAAEGIEGSGGDTGTPAEDVGQFLVVVEADFEIAGFEFATYGEAPLGHGDLVDEGGFQGADGLEVVEDGVAEFVEGFLVFEGDDGVFGDEAVFEGVEASGGLAFGGFGAGAALRVAAIGGNLFFGCHGFLRLLTRKVGARWQAPSMIREGL